jgi:TPR repeat protein
MSSLGRLTFLVISIIFTPSLLLAHQVSLLEGEELYKNGNCSEALNTLRPLAERGDATAQFYVGSILWQRYMFIAGHEGDGREVIPWLERAIQQEYGPAAALLAEIKLTASALLQTCLHHNEAACAPKNDQDRVSMVHQLSDLNDEVYKLLSKALQLNTQGASFLMGAFLTIGGTRYYDPQRGKELLLQGAEKGDLRAQQVIKESYHIGRPGFEQDEAKAEYWRQRRSMPTPPKEMGCKQ